MKTADRVKNVFPAAHDIPKAAAVAPLEQKEYLLDGKLKPWRGPAQRFSPVSVNLGKGLERRYSFLSAYDGKRGAERAGRGRKGL